VFEMGQEVDMIPPGRKRPHDLAEGSYEEVQLLLQRRGRVVRDLADIHKKMAYLRADLRNSVQRLFGTLDEDNPTKAPTLSPAPPKADPAAISPPPRP
jgi:hypothetical protein